MIRILLTGGENTVDVTELCPTVRWSGDYQQCARTLEFSLVSSYTDKLLPGARCELGDGVQFYQDARLLFDGFVVSRQRSTEGNTIDVTCFDRGWYLRRSTASYAFSGKTPETIARSICSDFGISVGELAATGQKITRNFFGVALYDIIITAYNLAAQESGKKYYAGFEGTRFCVREKKAGGETLIIEGDANLMDASITESVENAVSRVVIYDENDNRIKTLEDGGRVELYGVLQEYVKQSKDDDGKALKKAQKLLEDGGVEQKITVGCLGNVANISGGTVVVHEPYTGVYGLFYIDSDTHEWKNGQYYNSLTLNFKNLMDEKEAGSLPNKDGKKTAGKSSNKTNKTKKKSGSGTSGNASGGTWNYTYNPDGSARS